MHRVLVILGLLAIAALLLLAIPRTAKAPAAAQAQSRWNTVLTTRGVGTGATAPFAATRRWRVVWSAGPAAQPGASFGILVEQPGRATPYDTIANRVGAGKGSHLESGGGTFYLDVQSEEPYALQVQAFGPAPPAQPRYRWRTALTAQGAGPKVWQLPKLRAPWRIAWSSSQGSPSGTFAVSVLQPGQGLPVDFVANVTGPARGMAYEYSAGTFRLDVAASAPYTIVVEEGAAR